MRAGLSGSGMYQTPSRAPLGQGTIALPPTGRQLLGPRAAISLSVETLA